MRSAALGRCWRRRGARRSVRRRCRAPGSADGARQHDAHDRAGGAGPRAEADPPPIARTRRRAITRPRPTPAIAGRLAPEARSNGWNSFAAWDCVSPAPVSSTTNPIRSPSGPGCSATWTQPPGRLYFDGVETALKSTWRRRCASASTRTSVPTSLGRTMPCWSASGRSRSKARADQRLQFERAAVEREPVFLDALQVEQFVDQREQVLVCAQHVVGELAICPARRPGRQAQQLRSR